MRNSKTLWLSFISIARSSHLRCSIKKWVLRNFTNFTGKHLCQSLFFNKVAGPRHSWHSCFPVNFVKFLRTILQNTSGGCFSIAALLSLRVLCLQAEIFLLRNGFMIFFIEGFNLLPVIFHTQPRVEHTLVIKELIFFSTRQTFFL